MRWRLLLGISVVVEVLLLLYPNWLAYTANDDMRSNMTAARLRELMTRDLGHHWVFSPPRHEPGTEVWIDWSLPIAWAILCLVTLPLDAWLYRRRMAAVGRRVP